MIMIRRLYPLNCYLIIVKIIRIEITMSIYIKKDFKE